MPFRKDIGRRGVVPVIVQSPLMGSSLENMIVEFQLASDVRLQRDLIGKAFGARD